MPVDDPQSWLQGTAAIKNMMEAFRVAVGLVRETATSETDTTKRAALESALATAESSAKIAEAEIAKAFGYELCKCEFPPTIMKTVGHIYNPGVRRVGPVFECPKCGINTAAPFTFKRTAPDRSGG